MKLSDLYLLPDSNIMPWRFNGMQDLTATDALTEEGKYIVVKTGAPKGVVLIVTAVIPYAIARANVGFGFPEEVEFISPRNGNNFFIFEPRIKNKPAMTTFNVMGALTTAAGATAADPKTTSGITFISDDPLRDVSTAEKPGSQVFVVTAGQPLTVLFSLVPDPFTAGSVLPSRYSIGGSVAGTKRVDYAGAYLVGYQMQEIYYAQMKGRE